MQDDFSNGCIRLLNMSNKCIFVIIKECQQLVLQVKEAEIREAVVERDAMAKKVGGKPGVKGWSRRGRGKQRRGRGSLAYNTAPNSHAHIILTCSGVARTWVMPGPSTWSLPVKRQIFSPLFFGYQDGLSWYLRALY